MLGISSPSSLAPATSGNKQMKQDMPDSMPKSSTPSASTPVGAPTTGPEPGDAADAQEPDGLADFSVHDEDYDAVFPCVHQCLVAILVARREPNQGSAAPLYIPSTADPLPPDMDWPTLLDAGRPIVLVGGAVERAVTALQKLGIGQPGELEMWQAMRRKAWTEMNTYYDNYCLRADIEIPEDHKWAGGKSWTMEFPKQVVGVVRAAEREGQALLVFRPPSKEW